MSLSSRWTMPARGTDASCGARCSSVLQRAAAIARAGMDDEARWLVEHDQRVVLIDDDERDVLWRDRGRIGIGFDPHDDALASPHLAGRRDDAIVEGHAPRVDPRPQPAARVLRKRVRERGVEAATRGRGSERQRPRVRGMRGLRVRSRWRTLSRRMWTASHVSYNRRVFVTAGTG